MSLIIDCHGHYTTAPAPHDAWRKAQTDAFKTGGDIDPAYPDISDDEIRETIETNQLQPAEGTRRGPDHLLPARLGHGPPCRRTRRSARPGPGAATT